MDSRRKSPTPVYEFTAKVARVNTARFRGAREGDCVANVGEAGGAVLPVDGALGHIAVQYFEPLLTLAAADDLADPGASTSIAATVRLSSFART
jgi:hypothetical protein